MDVQDLVADALGTMRRTTRNSFARLDKKLRDFKTLADLDVGGGGDEFAEIFDGHANALAAKQASENKKKTKTLGRDWFNLQPAELTEEMRQDLKMLRLRNFVDPKRFYKAPVGMTQVLAVGTVIEGSGDSGARLTRKERKRTIVEEIMADKRLKDYGKRTYLNIQKEKNDKIRFRGGPRTKKGKPMKGAMF